MGVSAEITTRSETELLACVDALRQSHHTDRYPVRWPDDPVAWLSPPQLLGAWTAKANDRVIGHVILTALDEGRAEVSRLFVRPEARRSGLAVALLDAAVEVAGAAGRRVELNVVEDCVAAVRLYERLGWTLLGWGPAPFTRPDGTRPVERRYAAPVRG